MLMSMIGIQAFGQDFEATNADGVTIYYNYINNSTELAVTHRGSYDVFYSAYSGIVVIPETVTYNEKTFSVTSIEDRAFWHCTSVTKIISRATTPPACGSQALDDIIKWNCRLEVPQGTLSAYQAAEQWKEFFFIQEGDASTGISNTVVQPTSGTPTYHTLDGREVKNPGKGIYIVNGKKVLIK